ncbi:MAG: peptidylprolyl isomerase [Phycisphaerales bacterium]|nr:peptidylprolyl isomerase [Phycisphaerales bacterium]
MIPLLVLSLLNPTPTLLIKRPWAPAGGEMIISTWPNYAAEGTVVLMKHDGTIINEPATFVEGKINAIKAFPAIESLDHAAYLQLIVDDEPTGSPLVVTPALSRLIPVMEEDFTEGRGTWMRIVGWEDAGAEETEGLPLGSGLYEGAALDAELKRDESVIRSGWWVRPEMDIDMDTTMGEIRIDLREDAAPMTALNFQRLAEDRFYDGTIMHRIIIQGREGRPFVIQGGDPLGDGTGGPGWWQPIEASTLPHDFGVISMARSDLPDSAGSQWFIALDREETARLDGLYCAFGEVIDGREPLVKMAQVPIGDNEYLSSRPIAPPSITVMNLVPATPRNPGKGRSESRVEPPDTGPWSKE